MTDGRLPSLPTSVSIGGLDRSELRAALREQDIQLNPYAETLFEDPRFTTVGSRDIVEIAAFSVAHLGFPDGAQYGQLIARALESGWSECPLELGPHLRLQYRDQPNGADGKPMTHGKAPPGSITITSPPLDDTDETPKGFYLRRMDGVLWLRGYRSWPGHVWSPDDVLVFAR